MIAKRQIAVFVPGIMGSRLQTPEGKEVWPSSIAELLLPYKHMQDLMRDDLVPIDVIRRVSISSQYEGLIDHLERCGFRENEVPPSLYLYPYDWRKDNADAAEGLFAKLKKALTDHALTPVRITLIGHSMGGLVCRHLLESGRFDQTPEWCAIERLITLGTPHRGAPLALTAAMGLERRVFLSADQVRLLSSDSRYPSLYQLMPPQGEPFLWNEGDAYRVVDAYEPSVAASLNLVPTQLAAARAFHATLDVSRRPPHTRYFFFCGTKQRTITAITVRRDPSRPGAYLGHSARRLESDGSGDGTVPSWSSSLTGVQNQLVGGEHSVIFRSPELRLTLSGLLEKPGVLAAEAMDWVEIALRDRVMAPGDQMHITLTFRSPQPSIQGEVRLAPIDERGQATTYPIRYAGLAAETLSLALRSPGAPGIYRLVFHDGRNELGTDELFVQAEPIGQGG